MTAPSPPRVYVPSVPLRYDLVTGTKVPSVDLNPASAYGELVTVVDGFVSADGLNDAIRTAQTYSALIRPEDYVLVVGDVVIVSVVIATAITRNGVIKVLRWDKDQRTYDVIEVCSERSEQ